MRTFSLLVCSLLMAATATAQAPSEPWMTLKTAHFRVHYPADYEAWTLGLASRMESIHEEVILAVGYAPAEIIEVLVMDPMAQANGMAMPFLKHPRMVLWATPPESWSPIGHYRDWPELLFLHEDVHLVHLLRPSRGSRGRFIEHLFPLGAIGRKVPRWVSEGYATYLEGKMTGKGRPNGDFRAAILRKWALEGKLPSYGQMASDSESWMGMSMAYLMGSAYMEWLTASNDEGAWRRLWARLTARKDRAFDAAFEGVFGESPLKLYDRFTAELTWRAMELERRMKPSLAEGELWQDTSWTTSEPAISPDGTKMAIVLRTKDEPSQLVVWDMKPDPEAQKRWEEDIEKIRKNDPEDFPGQRTKPFPAKVLFQMPVSAAREPMNPRWLPDGKSILFISYESDFDGYFSPDIFRWMPESGAVRRITRGAHLKEADPFPDGKRAAAVQSQLGGQQLVEVDLESGEIRPTGAPHGFGVVFDHLRVHPDGAVCYMRHRDGHWAVVARSLSGNAEQEMPLPEGAFAAYPVWDPANRRLLAAIGQNGFIDICTWGEGGALTPLTRVRGAAVAPQPTPEGEGIYFLSLESDGLKVRLLKTDQPLPPMDFIAERDTFAPAVRPAPPAESVFKSEEADKPRPYGAGKQEFSLMFGGHWTSSSKAWEAGVRGGDVLGRFNYFAAGGGGEDGAPEGGTFALGWRGWPVEVTAQVYHVEQNPSEQKGWPIYGIPSLDFMWDRNRQGATLSVSKEWFLRRGRAGMEAGGLWEDAGHYGQDHGPDRRFAYLELSGIHFHPLGTWETLVALSARNEWGETEAFGGWEGWTRNRVEARAGVRKGETSLVIAYERRAMKGVPITYGGFIEAITLGGMETTLLPRAAQFDTVIQPAFMSAAMVGDQYEGWTVRAGVGGLPLFYQRHHFSWDLIWRDVAGFEWDMTSGPLALVRLPGFHFTLGGAYIFDAPLEGRTRFWLGISWTP